MATSDSIGAQRAAKRPLDIDAEVAVMQGMTVGQLRQRYADVYGEPTRSRHRMHLIRKIAWRMQALAEGDLSERARQRAEELANDADVRVMPPKARPCGQGKPRDRSATARQSRPIPGCPRRARRSSASTRDGTIRVDRPVTTASNTKGSATSRCPPWPRRSRARTATDSGSSDWRADDESELQQEHPRSAVQSTPASPPKKAWTRNSTRWTPSGNPARRTSPARRPKAGVPAGPLRRRRVHGRQHGPPRPGATDGRHRSRARSTAWSSTRSTA